MLDKKLMTEAKKSRRFLALTITLGMFTGLLTVLQAGYFARVVSGVFLRGEGLRQVWHWLMFLLAVIVLRAGSAWLAEVVAYRAAARIKEDLRQRLLAHLFALGPLYARGERTGELVNLVVEGVESLEAYFARYLPQLALSVLVPVLILGFVFPLDLLSGFIMLFTAPLIPLFMILIGKWADHLTQRQWDDLSRMSAHFLDVLQGLTTLKIFGRSKDQLEIIARFSDRFRVSTLGVLRVAFLSALVLELFSTISTALVAVALGLRLVYARITFEQAFFLLLLAPEFYLPLRMLGAQFHAGLTGVSAAKRIYEVLGLLPPGNSQGSTPLSTQVQLHLTFQDVHYAYDGNRPALQGVSFKVRPGERVALVGASGSGKSTVAGLLLRFMEPDSGRITVNGMPLRELPAQEWLRLVAYVPQHPYLFTGTVRANISLGQPEASMEEVIAAAKLARAHDFICSLPQGYDTPLGERGMGLSGGQARRIAIARAFLRNAPLLLLDEATAGLDPENEQEIEAALDSLMQGRTALIIAHRLSTVRRADRVLVLDKGRVAEAGKHEELMQREGIYYHLVTAFGGAA
ncbi:thiol reductant ABC exporter subunit CydD [Zhaonella formicivorans]|uniref:thiol reductant ABC exporter subunit CydD n=1 Tax=Zhaonella formicivorans TaxID=2528593 RepID=UPI003BF50D91